MFWHGIKNGGDTFSGQQVNIQNYFWPEKEISNLFLEELLNSLATVIVCIGAWLEGPAIGIATDVLAGAALGGLVYTTDMKGDHPGNLIAIEKLVKIIFQYILL